MEKGFEAYEVARAMIAALGPVAEALRARDGALADQVRRAGASVLLNLAEGSGRRGRDRMHCYRIAMGSAREVRAALVVARAWGWIGDADTVDALLDRVCAMLWRLTR